MSLLLLFGGPLDLPPPPPVSVLALYDRGVVTLVGMPGHVGLSDAGALLATPDAPSVALSDDLGVVVIRTGRGKVTLQ